MSTLTQYRIKVRDGSQGRVSDCLDHLDLDVTNTVREDGTMVMYAEGMCDMTPSQLQRELREMGCIGASVDSEYGEVRRDVEGPIRQPDDDVDYVADTDDYLTDFDVDLANDVLDRADAMLDVGDSNAAPDRVMGRGDADRDQQWFEGPGRQSFNEYVTQIVKELSGAGLSAGAAQDLLSQCVDDLVSRGDLPEIPEEGDPDEAYSRWVGTAKAAELMGICMTRAEEM